jgi:5'-nucleotidase
MSLSVIQILLTNDDGIHAGGLAALSGFVRDFGEVFVIAPDRESSGISHALTLNHPLRIREVDTRTYAMSGTPSDCVHLGINKLLPRRPDLVLSGINRGLNVGDDVTYSGTVCAAFEAAIHEIPAVALSLDSAGPEELEPCRGWVREIVSRVLKEGLPARSFLNVNIPNGTIRGIRFTVQGAGGYQGQIIEKKDPRGNSYFWIGGSRDHSRLKNGQTDYHAVKDGYISITPLKLDLTDYDLLKKVSSWDLKGG